MVVDLEALPAVKPRSQKLGLRRLISAKARFAQNVALQNKTCFQNLVLPWPALTVDPALCASPSLRPTQSAPVPRGGPTYITNPFGPTPQVSFLRSSRPALLYRSERCQLLIPSDA
ncbi:hypothetical protein BJ508DRAFT_50911 [Ascobolus immersus RN42]|uniref:Uncharacterized protein n=1 Tax=Ascobolus immersus RN42 TaxID=1160509 RepID=A0A3N4IGI0_ASCIM|nr:hypothetical protein BJ508DRAFT_50911 [Ascobolus immersus RN42]